MPNAAWVHWPHATEQCKALTLHVPTAAAMAHAAGRWWWRIQRVYAAKCSRAGIPRTWSGMHSPCPESAVAPTSEATNVEVSTYIDQHALQHLSFSVRWLTKCFYHPMCRVSVCTKMKLLRVITHLTPRRAIHAAVNKLRKFINARSMFLLAASCAVEWSLLIYFSLCHAPLSPIHLRTLLTQDDRQLWSFIHVANALGSGCAVYTIEWDLFPLVGFGECWRCCLVLEGLWG